MKLKSMLSALLVALTLLCAIGAFAQSPTPTPQFDFIGFIQEATLDTNAAICQPTDPVLAGGTMTVNGVKMIIPCNTILQMPATSVSWAQLFDNAVSAPVGTFIGGILPQGPGETRLALSDSPMPFPSFEVHAVGNVVNGKYIVGLITPVTQQGLNGGSGLISYIDYATGAFRIGGIADDPNCLSNLPGGGPTCSGALVQVNDPVGRYGLAHSIDPRFTVDTAQPTVTAATGYPVCIPRSDPLLSAGAYHGTLDTLCPYGNRPLNGDPRFSADQFLPVGAPLKTFTMPPPVDGKYPDARQQLPLMVGDWVDYTGTLFKLDPAAGSSSANSYISIHTLGANLGVRTAPGVKPAYVSVESILIGTGGAALPGLLQEATTRLTVIGTTTDRSQFVDVYAIDVNPCTGAESRRLLVTADPGVNPADPRGRFVVRILGGLFMPPTREYVVVSRTGIMPNVANGLESGQFRLPNFEFIFAEGLTFGAPILPNNFQNIAFLAQGSGPLFGSGPLVGQLDPWPGDPAPPKPVCSNTGVAPIVNAGVDTTVSSGAQVTLTGTAQRDPASIISQILWTQTAGPLVALSNGNTLTPSFTAPTVNAGQSVPLTFQLTVTDQFGTGTDSMIVTATRPTDIVTFPAAGSTWVIQRGKRGPFGKLNATAHTTALSGVSLNLQQIGVDGLITNWGAGSTTGGGTFTWVEQKGAAQPAKLIVNSTGGGSATAICGAPDARGIVTCQ